MSKDKENRWLIAQEKSEKLTYLGTQLDKFSNPDGDDPVQVEIVSATTLTTTTPGESFLDVD